MSRGKEKKILSGDVNNNAQGALEQAITEGLVGPDTTLEQFAQESQIDLFDPIKGIMKDLRTEIVENNRNVHNFVGD